MWSKCFALTTVMLTSAALTLPGPESWAGTRDEALLGDFNGDGLQDSATLGRIAPNLCSTIVEYGSASGVYLPPVAYTYLTPNGGGTPNCPDIGVALNVDDDPVDELYIGWTGGPPATVDFSRMVLQPPAFVPSAFYTSPITRPTFIGAGRFGQGGRESPYGVGPGGVINLIVDGSTIVPGPISYCSVTAPTVQLTDWNRDGVHGVLVSYTDGCEPGTTGSSGVVRIHHSGAVQQLQLDPVGRTTWTARVVDADGDRWLDVRTAESGTDEVDYFVNRGTEAPGTLVPSPDANTDRIDLTDTRPLAIDVLGNDHASRYTDITVTTPPRYGTTQIQSDRRIVYRPRADHGRTDRFSYQLSEEGKRSTATVTIRFPS
ncbi:Ig-like domain-containing protein [Micromonosporaceae bacterium B7E4]